MYQNTFKIIYPFNENKRRSISCLLAKLWHNLSETFKTS